MFIWIRIKEAECSRFCRWSLGQLASRFMSMITSESRTLRKLNNQKCQNVYCSWVMNNGAVQPLIFVRLLYIFQFRERGGGGGNRECKRKETGNKRQQIFKYRWEKHCAKHKKNVSAVQWWKKETIVQKRRDKRVEKETAGWKNASSFCTLILSLITIYYIFSKSP